MTEFSATDQSYMQRALELAQLGRYTTDPNPRVGCVIVKNNHIVGEGWHRYAGQGHAEVIALKAAGELATNATAYVTLEPCSKFGRTPPCVDSLLKRRLQRVVVAASDPSANGIELLQEHGISVDTGLLRQEALDLNQGFFKRIKTGLPWLTLKIAASIDGRTAMDSGESQWITGELARQDVHRLRAGCSAIVTGIGTVLADDPSLTARVEEPVLQPHRIVVDSHLRTPSGANIVGEDGKLLVACVGKTNAQIDSQRIENAEVISLDTASGRVDLNALMSELGRREINEVLVEAGPTLSGSFLRNGLVDRLVVYMAPKVLGNRAKGMFDLPQLEYLQDACNLEFIDIRKLGADIRIDAKVISN